MLDVKKTITLNHVTALYIKSDKFGDSCSIKPNLDFPISSAPNGNGAYNGAYNQNYKQIDNINTR